MNKKTIAYLALALLVGFIAYAQQFNPESNFRIARIDNGRAISITGYTGNSTAVNIPPQIQGLPVTAIGERAFARAYITSVSIPNSVTSIGVEAFAGCPSLTSVTIPDSVTFIGDRAFLGCASLTAIHVADGNQQFSAIDGVLYDRRQRTLLQYPGGKSGAFTIPNSVTSIGFGAFRETNLTSVTIPASVTSIRNQAFAESSLTSVTIPNSVTAIGSAAFYQCATLTTVSIPNSVRSIGEFAFTRTGLTSVTIPDSVTSIGDRAFSGCASLTVIHVSPGNQRFSTVDGVLYDRAQTTLIQYPGGKSGAFTIPNSVTSIGVEAFFVTGLTSVTFGESGITIGRAAFPGDLVTVYESGGAGTYTRAADGTVWTRR